MDIRHYYQEAGEGFPLVLLHGNGGDCSTFEKQMPAFGAHFHVYALDTRGHGKTPRGEAPFTFPQFADDLAGFLKEKGIQKAHVLGFSDGGNIAMVFALRHPQMVEKLVLNSANLDTGGVRMRYQLFIEAGYRLVKLLRAPREKVEMLGLMVDNPNINPQNLRQIKAKTLVIAGTRDMIKTEHSRLIARSIPGARLCLLPGGHGLVRERAEEYNREVLGFLLGGP